MYYLFIDESYNDDQYYIGGVLCTPSQISTIADNMEALARYNADKHGMPEPPEFHAHSIMNAQDDWKHLADDFRKPLGVFRKVLHIIANSGAAIYIEGVDVNRLKRRYKYPSSPYEISLRRLLEKINEKCMTENDRCIVLADDIPEKDAISEAIAGYTQTATPGYRMQVLGTIEPQVIFVDSRHSRIVQAADMCVYLARRVLENDSQSPQAARAAKRLYKLLEHQIASERKWRP